MSVLVFKIKKTLGASAYNGFATAISGIYHRESITSSFFFIEVPLVPPSSSFLSSSSPLLHMPNCGLSLSLSPPSPPTSLGMCQLVWSR